MAHGPVAHTNWPSASIELVASFTNWPNLLSCLEKPDSGAGINTLPTRPLHHEHAGKKAATAPMPVQRSEMEFNACI